MATFVSYSRSDAPFALKLATDLRAAGIDVWIDQLDILPGETWDRAIEAALDQCENFLVILSPDAVESRSVMDEVSYAIEEQKHVVPVVCTPCDLPFRLRRFQHQDFSEDYQVALGRLLRAFQGDAAGADAPTPPQQGDGSTPAPTPGSGDGTVPTKRRFPLRKLFLGALVVVPSVVLAVVLATGRGNDGGPAGTESVTPGDPAGNGQPSADRGTSTEPPVTDGSPADEAAADPRVEAERLARDWISAFLAGNGEGVVATASQPFFFFDRTIPTRSRLRSEYEDLWRQDQPRPDVEISGSRVQTVGELRTAGYDLGSESFGGLNLSPEDYTVTLGVSGRDAVLIVVREVGGAFEVLGGLEWDDVPRMVGDSAIAAPKKMSIRATTSPASVAASQKATITVAVSDESGRRVPGAAVSVSAGGGKFLETATTTYDPEARLHGPNSVSGRTGADGAYTAWWVCNPCAAGYGMSIKASKDGYANASGRLTVDVRTAPASVSLSGVYSIQQASNGRYVDAHQDSGNDFGVVTRPAQNNATQRWIVTALGNDQYTIQQQVNRRYMDAHEDSGNDFRVVTRPAQNNTTQRWIVTALGNDQYAIQQQVNRRYLDAHEAENNDFRLVTRPAQNDATQRWIIRRR